MIKCARLRWSGIWQSAAGVKKFKIRLASWSIAPVMAKRHWTYRHEMSRLNKKTPGQVRPGASSRARLVSVEIAGRAHDCANVNVAES